MEGVEEGRRGGMVEKGGGGRRRGEVEVEGTRGKEVRK